MTDRASSRGTIVIAGTANLLVGVIKLAAGIMAGSMPCSPKRRTRPRTPSIRGSC